MKHHHQIKSFRFGALLCSMFLLVAPALADNASRDVKALKKRVSQIESRLKSLPASREADTPVPLQLKDVIVGRWAVVGTTAVQYNTYGIRSGEMAVEFVASSPTTGTWSSTEWPMFFTNQIGIDGNQGNYFGSYRIVENIIFGLDSRREGEPNGGPSTCPATQIEPNKIVLHCAMSAVVLTRVEE